MTHKESVSLVEAAAGEELSAGREGDAVHRLLVPAHHAGQCHASRHQHHSRHAGLCRHHHHVSLRRYHAAQRQQQHHHSHDYHHDDGRPCQCVDTGSLLHVPQTHSGVETGRGEHLKKEYFYSHKYKKRGDNGSKLF